MTVKTLNIQAICIDGGTQSRVEIDNNTVAEYVEAIKAGDQFPPVIVYFDGADHWLADGFHRWHGHRTASKASIEADVRTGTQRDAILFSLGANKGHGLRPTNQDKRKSVARMLADAEWSEMSDREIAKHCGCSHTFVANIRSPRQADTKPAASPAAETGNVATPRAAAPATGGNVATPPAASMPTAPTEREVLAQQMADDAHGDTDVVAELESAHRTITSLEDRLRAAEADDTKAEILKFQKLAHVAHVRQNELQAAVNDREATLKRITNALRRCGKAVGEDDPANIASKVEAFVRNARVTA